MKVVLSPFIRDYWRTKPLADGTLWEVRRHGHQPTFYSIFELANEDANGELVISWLGSLAQCRLEIAHLIECHRDDARHAKHFTTRSTA